MSKEQSLPDDFESMVDNLCEHTNLPPTRAKVLALIKLRRGKSEIADILDISKSTVQNHIQDLRKEVRAAEELIDMAGTNHYSSGKRTKTAPVLCCSRHGNTYYESQNMFEEFGGELWCFRSGMRYHRNSDTSIEKKLYASPNGSCLLVEREIVKKTGEITETRNRTEFYSGNDIPHHMFRKDKFDSPELAKLYVEFLENAGIDPIFSPSELCSTSLSNCTFDIVKTGNWVELSD
jgi:hypothetical protein